MDTARAVRDLWGHDPQFTAFAKSLGASDPQQAWEMLFTREGVAKMSPDVSDVHVPGASKVRVKWGVATKRGKRQVPPAGAKVIGKAVSFRPLLGVAKLPKRTAAKRTLKPMKNPGAGAMLAAGVGGAATLYGAQKVARDPNAVFGPITAKFRPKNPDEDIVYGKSVDWQGMFSKVDDEKRQVFGWASIVSVNGKPVVDRQGDVIELEEIEKSAYDYVIKSRTGGRQHRRDIDGSAFKASDMIESLVVTPEKRKYLGLTDDSPTGWWVGFKVHDDDTWEAVKRGEVTGFSIHGAGKRTPIEGEFSPQRTEVA